MRDRPPPSHQPCRPRALRAIRSWLTPTVILHQWWQAWADKDPTLDLRTLIDAVTTTQH